MEPQDTFDVSLSGSRGDAVILCVWSGGCWWWFGFHIQNNGEKRGVLDKNRAPPITQQNTSGPQSVVHTHTNAHTQTGQDSFGPKCSLVSNSRSTQAILTSHFPSLTALHLLPACQHGSMSRQLSNNLIRKQINPCYLKKKLQFWFWISWDLSFKLCWKKWE